MIRFYLNDVERLVGHLDDRVLKARGRAHQLDDVDVAAMDDHPVEVGRPHEVRGVRIIVLVLAEHSDRPDARTTWDGEPLIYMNERRP